MAGQWLLLFLLVGAGDLVHQLDDCDCVWGSVTSTAQSARLPVNGPMHTVGKQRLEILAGS